MKTSHSCPKCRSETLLVLPRIAFVVDKYGSSEPWRIARVPTEIDGYPLPGGEPVSAGIVEAYICKRCGYTEFYTQSPDSIPVDGRTVREVRGKSGGPYR